MKGKKLLIRLAAVLVCVGLAALMMVIGRGHTVYLDNKTLEYNGTEYKAFYKVEVTVKGEEKPLKLMARDRDVTKWIGQSFQMDLLVTEKEGDPPRSYSVKSLKLPYGMDGPILNLPALLAGLPQDAWLDEFIPAPSTEDADDEVDIGDAFNMGGEATGEDASAGLGDDDIMG